jgi:hypothetical protein
MKTPRVRTRENLPAKPSDTEIIDWLEARKDRALWSDKSWLYRGGDGPELVFAKAGDKWPEGVTRATWREAAIDAMRSPGKS